MCISRRLVHNGFYDADATNALAAPPIPGMMRRAHRFADDAAVQDKPPTITVVADDAATAPTDDPDDAQHHLSQETEPRS